MIIITKQSHSNIRNFKSRERWKGITLHLHPRSPLHFLKVLLIKDIFKLHIKGTHQTRPPCRTPTRGFKKDQGRISQLPSSLLEVKIELPALDWK